MHDKISEKIVYFIDSMQYYFKDIIEKNMDEIFKKKFLLVVWCWCDDWWRFRTVYFGSQ